MLTDKAETNAQLGKQPTNVQGRWGVTRSGRGLLLVVVGGGGVTGWGVTGSGGNGLLISVAGSWGGVIRTLFWTPNRQF